MNLNDIIGSIGVGMILIAYFLSIFKFIPHEGKGFFYLNILGSGLACYASWLIGYIPFVILEGTWFIISIIGLLKIIR
jgi:hypothetical protein